MGPQDEAAVRSEVVGVVLHEGGAPRQPERHGLRGAQQRRGLPVALAPEAVTVGHQALDRQTGQLPQTAQVFEVGGEGAEATGGEEVAQSGLDAGRVPQGRVAFSARTQFGGQCVAVRVLPGEGQDGAVVHGVHGFHQLVDAVGVDGRAEPELGLDLVPFGDRDVPHVVPEAGEAQPRELGPADGGTRPGGDAAYHLGRGDVPRHGFAGDAQAGLDVAELAVPVGRLVEIHEVHVDRGPGSPRFAWVWR